MTRHGSRDGTPEDFGCIYFEMDESNHIRRDLAPDEVKAALERWAADPHDLEEQAMTIIGLLESRGRWRLATIILVLSLSAASDVCG